VIDRFSPENQIPEDIQGKTLVDGDLQNFPVTSVKLTALDAVQFRIIPLDSVQHVVNRQAKSNSSRRTALRMNGDTSRFVHP